MRILGMNVPLKLLNSETPIVKQSYPARDNPFDDKYVYPTYDMDGDLISPIPSIGNIKTKDKLIPIMEVYGPVCQGEGIRAGEPTIFIRTGGCSYRCTWCDTLYAVLPHLVAEHAHRLTTYEIMDRIAALNSYCRHITLSGGDPCMHDLTDLVNNLQDAGYAIGVETQGAVFAPWLHLCETVTISPKPPSSNMKTDYNKLTDILLNLDPKQVCIKIVIFDDADYEYAVDLFTKYRNRAAHLYLQPGSPVIDTSQFGDLQAYRDTILLNTQSIIDKVIHDSAMVGVRVMPQIHALIHGNKQGV